MKNKKKLGFTLIEIIVVVASIGLIMTSVVGMVLGTFKVQDRTKSNNKITESSSWIISQLRSNILNSLEGKIVCGVDNLSIQVTNSSDGKVTTLSCNKSDNKIASTSAEREYILNNTDVTVTNCDSFVVCQLDNNDDGEKRVLNVVFNFGIGTTTGGVNLVQDFTTTVTVRN